MTLHLPVRQWMLAVFVVWLVCSTAVLFYSGNRHYGTFADSGSWQPTAVDAATFKVPAEEGFYLLHVFAPGCACNARAEQHIRQLNVDDGKMLSGQRFTTAEDIAHSGLILPATPAVLIFYAGKLIYAGPYASDPSCSVANSLILPILKQQVILPGLWLNGESYACRCPTV